MAKRCTGKLSPALKLPQIRPTADELAWRAFEPYERRCSIDGWDIDETLESDGGPLQERKCQVSP